MGEWKPIGEYVDLPHRDVLAWNGLCVFPAWLSDDDGWHDARNRDHNDYPEDPQPTHFMEFPAPPSQEEG
jgi:hypothetical protein